MEITDNKQTHRQIKSRRKRRSSSMYGKNGGKIKIAAARTIYLPMMMMMTILIKFCINKGCLLQSIKEELSLDYKLKVKRVRMINTRTQ